MNKQLGLLFCCLSLSSCAFPGTVQRIGVEYNTAVAGMANELTLLNILRAKESMPLHYTSVGRLSGSVLVKGTSSINAQLRESSNVNTVTDQTVSGSTVAATTTTTSTATKTLANALSTGGNVITPAFGGEVSTGPSFDIAILDTQKFYQGILSAVPFPTVENFINQGYDNDLIKRVLIERIELRLSENSWYGEKGQLIKQYLNEPAGANAKDFADIIGCYDLVGAGFRKPAVPLTTVSRVTRDAKGRTRNLTVDELTKFDGKTLDVVAPKGSDYRIPKDAALDPEAQIQRLSEEKRVADLVLRSPCKEAVAIDQSGLAPPKEFAIGIPGAPPPEGPLYVGNNTAMVLGRDPETGRAKDEYVRVDISIVFRSTEGAIRYVGRYLYASETKPDETWKIREFPLFSVSDDVAPNAVVSTTLLGKNYSIANDVNRRQNMMVIGLLQQLVNLHKESGDRPTTVPVQVIQ